MENRGDIVMNFWDHKFMDSLTNEHIEILLNDDLYRHEIFCEVITWFESYMNGRFKDDTDARVDLEIRLQNNHEFYLHDDELDKIME